MCHSKDVLVYVRKKTEIEDQRIIVGLLWDFSNMKKGIGSHITDQHLKKVTFHPPSLAPCHLNIPSPHDTMCLPVLSACSRSLSTVAGIERKSSKG